MKKNGQAFFDCVTQIDAFNQELLQESDAHSFLRNTGAIQNNCANQGGNPQFEDATTLQNTTLLVQDTTPIRLGTIAAGDIDGQGPQDIAMVYVDELAMPIDDKAKSVMYQFSDPQGGFPGNFAASLARLAPALPYNERPLGFPSNVFDDGPSILSQASERSLLLSDCDGDGLDEGLVAVQWISGSKQLGLMLLENSSNNPGLQNADFSGFTSFPIDITNNTFSRVTLSAGDFNGDGQVDVGAAVNVKPGNTDPDSLVLCLGDGACGFSCSQNGEDLVFALPGADPHPTSLSSGDFNGDGRVDLAVALPGISSIAYLFNDPSKAFSQWPLQQLAISQGNNLARPLHLIAGRFSAEAFASNTDEIAVATPRFVQDPNDPLSFSATQGSASVEVIPTNGQGGLSTPLSLAFSVPDTQAASAIYAGPIDLCGGDDILVLGQTRNENNFPLLIDRRAHLFLNANEAPALEIPLVLETVEDSELTINATCLDPTRDDRSFQWSVVSGPQGAQTSFSVVAADLSYPDQQANTIFTTDTPGDYSVKLSCQDACGATVEKLLQIKAVEAPPPPPPPPVPVRTQGGCVASLNPVEAPSSASAWWIGTVSLAWVAVRKRRQE